MADCNCTCPILGSHDPDCAVYGVRWEPASSVVELACGHSGIVWGQAKPGAWVSCWAVVINAGGKIADACQAQRKIVTVQESL